jgi:plasmid stabilization system protein ParE
MASQKRTLTVIVSPTASDELHDIWQWNAEHYNPSHADAYLRYLKRSIDDLVRLYQKGKAVAGRSDLRYIVIRQKTKGHGHIAVYRFNDKEVDVLHVFHSAQDWPAKLLSQ